MKRKVFLVLFISVIFLILQLGCKNLKNDLSKNVSDTYMEDDAEHDEIPMTNEDFIEDYDYLWEVLEENCPYLPCIERQGFDLYRMSEKYRNIVSNEAVDIYSFSQIMFELSEELIRTGQGHLSILDPQSYSYITFLFNYATPRYNRHLDIITNEQSTKIYEDLNRWLLAPQRLYEEKVLGHPFILKDPFVNTEISGMKNTSKPEFDTSTYSNIGYMKIDSFLNSGYLESNREKILGFYKEIENKEHLIIDIADNSGGDDAYWMFNLVAPNIWESATLETYQGSMNGDFNLYYQSDNEEGQEEYESDLGSFTAYRKKITKEEFSLLSEDWTELNEDDVAMLDNFYLSGMTIHPSLDEPAFKGKIWLLIDRAVFSASEGFTVFCKQTGFATVVGKTTGGNGIGVSPYHVALPNSGLILGYDGMYGFNIDGSLNGEVGTHPDIFCNEGETPLDACLRAIKEYDIN